MTCDEVRDELMLILYGETEEERRLRVEAHLQGCGACRLLLAEERRLVSILSIRSMAEPSDGLLERCRQDLAAALRREASRPSVEAAGDAPGRWAMPGVGSTRSRLKISPALAAGLLAAGFLAGGLAPWRPPFPDKGTAAGGPAEGREAELAGPAAPEETAPAISGLRSLVIDPAGGRVRLTYETLGRSRLEGAPTDPAVRRALLETVNRSPNAGLRLDAIQALEGQAGDREVRAGLLDVVRRDANIGARLKAIDALQAHAWADAGVRRAILEALLRDRNQGVRVRAVDVLAGARGPETLPVLRRLASDDPNAYVRLRSASALEAAYRPGDGGRR